MNQQGYWVGDEFVETETPSVTAVELKKQAKVDGNRRLIALSADGTWKLVEDGEVISPGKHVRYEDVPPFVHGDLANAPHKHKRNA